MDRVFEKPIWIVCPYCHTKRNANLAINCTICLEKKPIKTKSHKLFYCDNCNYLGYAMRKKETHRGYCRKCYKVLY